MKIAYQGRIGAYSNIAAENIFNSAEYIEFDTFEEAMTAVKTKKVDYAVIPVENSNAGRVSDVHFLLPKMGVFIVGEYFLKVEHQLWGLKGTKLKDIKEAYSHPQALAQCSDFLKKHKIKPIARIDTAKSCEDIVKYNDKHIAAIASKKAGEVNDLELLAKDIHNAEDNTTRFLVLSNKEEKIKLEDGQKYISSFIFKINNTPAALYKALGGFATNGVNILKIESYLLNGEFYSAQFYIEACEHIKSPALQRAIEELKFFCPKVEFLGTYKVCKDR